MWGQRVMWSTHHLCWVENWARISTQCTGRGVHTEASPPTGRAQPPAGEPRLSPALLPITLRTTVPGPGSLYPLKWGAGQMARNPCKSPLRREPKPMLSCRQPDCLSRASVSDEAGSLGDPLWQGLGQPRVLISNQWNANQFTLSLNTCVCIVYIYISIHYIICTYMYVYFYLYIFMYVCVCIYNLYLGKLYLTRFRFKCLHPEFFCL